MNKKPGERLRLARDACRALSLYVMFLLPPMRKAYPGEEGAALRKTCLNDARRALGEQQELNEEAEPR